MGTGRWIDTCKLLWDDMDSYKKWTKIGEARPSIPKPGASCTFLSTVDVPL